MSFFKKNIWIIFYFLLAISTLFLSLISLQQYRDYKEKFILQNKHITEVVGNSVNSFFLQNELMLDILGKQLLKNESYKNQQESKEAFLEYLSLNSAIAGIGLVGTDGKLLSVSYDLPLEKFPNLLEVEQAKESFLQTLQEDKMVLGRTYYLKGFFLWAIPIRKTLRDKNGEAIAVISAGLKIDKNNKIFKRSILLDESHSVRLFRESDRFTQYIISKESTDLKTYSEKVPIDVIRDLKKKIEVSGEKSIKKVMEGEEVVAVEHIDYESKRRVLSVVRYDTRYNLWIINQITLDIVKRAFYKFLFMAVTLFFLVNTVLFYLFRYIDKIEKEKQETLYNKATHDNLTNLPNRFYLNSNIHKWTEDESREFSLLFIDMDNFKYINDNYGHNYGDKVLQEIAYRLESFLQDDELVVRQGGDEFIILTHKEQGEALNRYLTDLKDLLIDVYEIGQYKFLLGVSIGISSSKLHGRSLNELLRCADIAMYVAKKRKNSFCFFDKTIENNFKESGEIESELKFALDKEEFFMVYQPQVYSDGTLYGVESLLRWENEKLGLIPPDKFIGIAEDTGVMVDIGSFVLQRSLKEISVLQKELGVEFALSINISLKQFMEKNFFPNLISLVESSELKRVSLTLEITESIFIDDLEYILSLLEKIQENSIKISLDDFGTGYSSLSLLNQLPIDELKIDKSFVDNILKDEQAKSMVQSIISIGRNFNFHVLAEGIEEREQMEVLDSFGCNTFQGYYFSKPVKIDGLREYLSKN